MSCECLRLKRYEQALRDIVNSGNETIDKWNNDVIFNKEQTIALLALREVFPEENHIEMLISSIKHLITISAYEDKNYIMDTLYDLVKKVEDKT